MLLMFLVLAGCTKTYSPHPTLAGDGPRELAPLSRDEYELTQGNLTGRGSGWQFFWGYLGGVSKDEISYGITRENNVDGLMLTYVKEEYPWYGVVLGLFTYGLVLYHEVEVSGIGIVVKRDE